MTSDTTSPSAARVQSVYQPIVELATQTVVGYEALARWRSQEPPVAPDFHDDTDLGEIEWACRIAALDGALQAGLDRGTLLFVNVEPRILLRHAPEAFLEVFGRARDDLRVIIELTERDLLSSPRELFEFADRIRALGWGLALDDVGVQTESLAVLPFLDPNVVKFDISLVQNDPTADQARTLTGVLAHSERNGTALLAEGIETEAHLERARTLGAVLGQGYLFGRPGPLPPVRPAGPVPLPGVGRHRSIIAADVPGRLLDSGSTRVARKPVLQRLSRQLERQAGNRADPSVLLATFQRAERFEPVGDRYRELAAVCRFVGVLGEDMPAEPLPGVRGATVAADDPLAKEWTIVVVGSHYAAALIAVELDAADGTTDDDRRFAFLLTHDRDTAVAAGRQLLRRFGGIPA